MRNRVAFPFLTLPDDVVKQGQWLIGNPGQPLLPAEDILDDWDYARDLEVAKQIEVDMAAAAAALAIPENHLKLKVYLRVGTGAGRYPKRTLIVSRAMLDPKNFATTLRAEILSQKLSTRLLLEVGLVLGEESVHRNRLSPRLLGSRLWNDQRDILLEGGGAGRFPLESASFSQMFAGRSYSKSLWYLWWQTDAWDVDFSSAVCLYINADYPEFESRVIEGDVQTLQMVMGSIAAQMIRAFLKDREASERLDDFPEGTMGAQVGAWLRQAFPQESLESVRSEVDFRPGSFQATVLAAMELGVSNESS